ncbi:MAG: type II toxin-antitoxin system VapC family toxin [Chloroflexi bacterium]|nr:type II toxin-antitoxin system VapC family toxin [Chloroflexota bacterium]
MNHSLILADTGALYALMDKSDVHHAEAVEFYQRASESLFVVIEYVLVETMTLLRRRGFSHTAVLLRERLDVSQSWRLLLSNADMERATFDIYRRYDDKNWSYTDCALLVASRMFDDAPIFSFDHHIRQMGVIVHP